MPAQTAEHHRYAVATHSFLVVVTVDAAFEVVDYAVVGEMQRHHYGIALLPEGGFVYKHSDEELRRAPSAPPFAPRTPIAIDGEAKYVHQVAAAHGGGFYLANTDLNCITYLQLNRGTRHDHYFDGRGKDRNHVNSVLPYGAHHVLALLHNKGRDRSEVVVLRHHPRDGFTREHRFRLWHDGCHNLYVEPGRLYYNASADECFVAVDLHKQAILRQVELGGHVKGLSLREGHFVVGVSDVATRAARKTTCGHLSVIDHATLSHTHTLDLNFDGLPHPIGNVNEVRCISGGEEAHACLDARPMDWRQLTLNRATMRERLAGVSARVRSAVRRLLPS
jgi:hypothetical protein